MKRYLWLMVFLLLTACSGQDDIKDGKVMTVKSQPYANSLYYTGTVQPLKTLVIPSPADGVVIDMPFQYGEPIESGKLLFTLSSSKFSADYKRALMDYVKAKSEFNNSQTQLSESEFLHKNQLISDDEYKLKKSNFFGAQLTLIQAKDVLDSLISQLNVHDVDIDKLSISDIDKITQAMHLQSSAENLQILAPAQGVVLSAVKGEEEAKKTLKGDAVKQGDVLAIIGDMSGLSVRIKVNELTVNQLKIGQRVTVTGIAFPEYTLEGKIQRVDRQGEVSNGGMPNFTVEIMVPTLTKNQQRDIHVGMSAKVEINIEEESKVMIPINALVEKNGESFVKVLDRKSGKLHEVNVKTGKSTVDAVAILSGLKEGDRIVIAS